MLLQNIWKILKYFYFFVVFLFAFFPLLLCFLLLPPTVRWWRGGKRLHVSLWCVAASYTPCILDILSMCVYISKMSNRLCASASASVNVCMFVCLFVDSSLHSKAAGLLHSRQQFLVKFLVRLVRRDVYPVEAKDKKGPLLTFNLTLLQIQNKRSLHLALLRALTMCEPWAGCLCWRLSSGWWRALVLQNL